MKRSIIIICAVLAGLGIIFAVTGIGRFQSVNEAEKKSKVEVGLKNGMYLVEGSPVVLHDGLSEVEAAPGSSAKIVTRYFGNDASGDLDGDGALDTAFLLTQETGGSGTFFYVAVSLAKGGVLQGTNAIFLGDRIAPQTTEIHDGLIVVNYAERKADEPMTAQPSIGVSKRFVVKSGNLIAEDPSGEKVVTPEPTRPTGKISGRQWAKDSCIAEKGNWDEQYGECTGISESLCTTIGGEWNDCASACRHDPDAQVCTMQCVLVCTIKE